jgi:hypothetical protein
LLDAIKVRHCVSECSSHISVAISVELLELFVCKNFYITACSSFFVDKNLKSSLILVYFHLDFGIIPCKSAHLSWRKTFSILGYLNGGIFQIWVLWSFNCYFFRLRLFLKQKLFCWLHLSKSFQIVERWCWIVQFKIQLKYFNKNLSISRLNNFKLSNLLNNLSLILFCLFLNSKLGQLLISSLKNFCNFAKKLSPWFKGIVLIFLCNLSSISKVRRI